MAPKSPKTKIAKIKSAKTKSAKTKSPKTKSPKTKSPKTKSPKTKSPKTKSAKTKSAKTKSVKTKSAKTKGAKAKSSKTSSQTTDLILIDSSAESATPRNVNLTLILKGTPPGPGEYELFAFFNGTKIISEPWFHGNIIEPDTTSILNLNDRNTQTLVANTPLILILRSTGGAVTKETDPLAHPQNRAGASVDLFPLILGEQKISVTTPLVSISTGERTDCSVIFHAGSEGTNDNNLVPLTLTMISVHCLPAVKDNTLYVSAIGLNELHEPKAINFNLSLSTQQAEKIVFASVSTAGYAANTAMNVHTEDKFIPNDLKCYHKNTCRSAYWNSMRRLLVDPDQLYERLSSPFMLEVAGVPRLGKIDIRGRYMGIVDARVLLEPGQMGVSVCTKLLLYNEGETLDNIGPLLQLPPVSAKASARDTNTFDEFDHSAYAVIRFDLTESLVPKSKSEDLYQIMGLPAPGDANVQFHDTVSDSVHDDPIDARTIRKEAGALAVHKELSGLACKGMIPMTQGIKRTAANRLLMRVRAMLKSFPPGECSYLDYEDTVTGQHAASRRAVTASFAPQPPPPRLPEKVAAARCRIAGDTRIANSHLETSLKVPENHVSILISKVLRCLEERNDGDAMIYLLEALGILTTNRYLLWIFGGLQFDNGRECSERAGAALRIAAKGDYSDGTANAIAWAALHTFHHCNGNICAAFVAARKMRKAFSLPLDWDQIVKRWIETSGEEEVYWRPEVVSSDNPLLIAAAFFLCLRCYRFSEKLLNCVEQECLSSGVGTEYIKSVISEDLYYLRAASLVLRRNYSFAMEMIQSAIDKFGPTPKMFQMRTTCLACMRNWDNECEKALVEAETAGSVLCSSSLYASALSELKVNPNSALQRAAGAHKRNPSGHTALLIGRIYAALDKQWIAERWLAVAVNTEPLLADGWAMVALLAMYDGNLNKARVMLRTARQAGPISPDIEEELQSVMEMVELDPLPDFLVDNLCLCDHID